MSEKLIVRWHANLTKLPHDLVSGPGTYVKNFEYSQGYFSCLLTDDIGHAMDFTDKKHCYETFFKPRNANLLKCVICFEVMEYGKDFNLEQTCGESTT